MKKKLPQEGFGPNRRPGEASESDVEGHSLGDQLRMPIDAAVPAKPGPIEGLTGRPRTGGELVDLSEDRDR